jgi:hypothetical protein
MQRNRSDRKQNDKELRPLKKHPNGSILYTNLTVKGPVCRLSFVSFVTPKESENDDGTTRKNYGCAALFPKGTNISLLREACERFARQEKGDKYKRYKAPIREQDDKVGEYDGFEEGAFYFNTSSKYPPKCIGRNREEIDISSFYSGCYARLLFRPYLYDRLGNRGVGLGLAGAQFIRDGEPLGGGGYDPETWASDEGDEIDDADGQYGADEEEMETRPARRPVGKKPVPKKAVKRETNPFLG